MPPSTVSSSSAGLDPANAALGAGANAAEYEPGSVHNSFDVQDRGQRRAAGLATMRGGAGRGWCKSRSGRPQSGGARERRPMASALFPSREVGKSPRCTAEPLGLLPLERYDMSRRCRIIDN